MRQVRTRHRKSKQYDEVALDDEINLTGRTLVKYRFRGIEHDTTSWAEMYAAVLKELHNADKSYLNYLADADDSVDLSIHVSRTSDNYTSCVKVDEDIYVWTGTATQYKINLLRSSLSSTSRIHPIWCSSLTMQKTLNLKTRQSAIRSEESTGRKPCR